MRLPTAEVRPVGQHWPRDAGAGDEDVHTITPTDEVSAHNYGARESRDDKHFAVAPAVPASAVPIDLRQAQNR
jgi:hypothetical protein